MNLPGMSRLWVGMCGGLKEGDFVAVDPNVTCGTCRWCKAGRPNLCSHLTPIGVSRPGAAAAMIEPLACALHAVESSKGVKDRSVLVLGGGTMGMLIALSAKAQGAGSVAIADLSEAKLGIARQAGIADARHPSALSDDKFDVVFEAAGVPRALAQAMEVLEKNRHAGTGGRA